MSREELIAFLKENLEIQITDCRNGEIIFDLIVDDCLVSSAVLNLHTHN